MPVHLAHNKDGCYAQWGDHGAKYFYECGNTKEKLHAMNLAYKQGIAIGEFKVTHRKKKNKNTKS